MIENAVPVKPEGVSDGVWAQMLSASPVEARHLIRSGAFTAPTSGLCPGYAQANLIVLPKEQAYDFLLFAQRNPKPCPLLEVTEVGAREATICASDCDIATDFPRYRIYEHGDLVAEVENVEDYWRDDLVSFVIGCSFSFESELIEAGIEIRHNTMGRNVPMYLTGVPCTPAGSMSGNMVMSMRPIPYRQVVQAVQISGAIPKVHGAPIHIGSHRRARPGASRVRRPGGHPRGRSARVLGVRRHAPVHRHEQQAALRHHPCAGLHAHHGYQEHQLEGIDACLTASNPCTGGFSPQAPTARIRRRGWD